MHMFNILIIKDQYCSGVLVWRVEKVKKLDFILDFYYLDAVFSRSKENDRKKAKELEDRLILQEFSAFLRFWWLFYHFYDFLLFFLLGFALDFLVVGRQVD